MEWTYAFLDIVSVFEHIILYVLVVRLLISLVAWLFKICDNLASILVCKVRNR